MTSIDFTNDAATDSRVNNDQHKTGPQQHAPHTVDCSKEASGGPLMFGGGISRRVQQQMLSLTEFRQQQGEAFLRALNRLDTDDSNGLFAYITDKDAEHMTDNSVVEVDSYTTTSSAIVDNSRGPPSVDSKEADRFISPSQAGEPDKTCCSSDWCKKAVVVSGRGQNCKLCEASLDPEQMNIMSQEWQDRPGAGVGDEADDLSYEPGNISIGEASEEKEGSDDDPNAFPGMNMSDTSSALELSNKQTAAEVAADIRELNDMTMGAEASNDEDEDDGDEDNEDDSSRGDKGVEFSHGVLVLGALSSGNQETIKEWIDEIPESENDVDGNGEGEAEEGEAMDLDGENDVNDNGEEEAEEGEAMEWSK